MGFRINTNVAAMNAHMNSVNNNRGLDKSLSALSTGLRINKAADDASGMAIANQLKSQANGLGQAIRNANDGINVAQTADGALEEYTNIINTVRTKAIQAASDGQNDDSRQAIQNDINKLLEEANNISESTSFNGMNLLDGSFKDKSFHIGAYAAETVDISIDNTKTNAIGDIKSVTTKGNKQNWDQSLTGGEHIVEGKNGYNIKAGELKVNGSDITEALNTNSKDRLLDAKSVANAITKSTGMLATAKTEVNGTKITASSTALDGDTNDLKINGISVGNVTFSADDADNALTNAINNISELTGVTAENVDGRIKLTAEDGRNIAIDTKGNGANAKLTETVTTNQASATKNELTSTSTSELTIAKGELVINGVDMAGTYGATGVTGSAHDELEKAIKAIDGLENSSITTDGKINLEVNTGADLNISGTKANSDFHLEKGIKNNSTQGDVTIISDKPVKIDGENAKTFGFKDGSFTPDKSGLSLDKIDVTTREGAEVAIKITDNALKQIDSIRSKIGSTQNQLESTVRNISVTQVNVTAAESTIRDVDFASESANLSKHNILAKSGVYAMSQANAAQQNVMTLLR